MTMINNNICCHVLQGPGQEYNDIQELQDLWLSAHGRRRDQGNLYIHATGIHHDNALVQNEAPVCII